MAFCENCGRELSDQAISCPNCGHPRTPAGLTRCTGWGRPEVIVGIPSLIIMAAASIGTFSNSTITRDEFGNPQINSSVLARFFVAWLIVAAIGIAYRTVLEGGARGQTLGKMVMKIAVKDAETGGPIGYGRAFARWLVASILWIAFYLPGILDVLFPLWDSKKQTLHDKAVRSVVLQVT